jgi:hypothetical protein
MATTIPMQRTSGRGCDVLVLTFTATDAASMPSQGGRPLSRFQQLLNRKLEAEKTTPGPSSTSMSAPNALDVVRAKLQGADTVVNTVFASQHFGTGPGSQSVKAGSDRPMPVPVPQYQANSTPYPSFESKSPYPAQPGRPELNSSQDSPHLTSGVPNSDQVSNQFRNMVAQRIATMFAISQANMNGIPEQGNNEPHWAQSQEPGVMTPYQQMVQAKFAAGEPKTSDVKIEPGLEMPSYPTIWGRPRLTTPPAVEWRQHQPSSNPPQQFDSYESAYPFMYQRVGEPTNEASGTPSAKSTTSSLPIPSPTTPRQSTGPFYTSHLPPSYSKLPNAHNHRVSDASSADFTEPELAAPTYPGSHLSPYRPAVFANTNGAVRLLEGARYTNASNGGEANGSAGPSHWDNAGSNGNPIGGAPNGNNDAAGNGDMGYVGGDGGAPGDGSGGGDGGDGGSGGDGGGGGGDGSTPKKKLGEYKRKLEVEHTDSHEALACHFCRRRKLKCDGQRPTCENCHKRGETCTWDDFVRRRGPGKRTKELRDKARREAEAAGLTVEDINSIQQHHDATGEHLDVNGDVGPGPSTLAEAGEPKRKKLKSEALVSAPEQNETAHFDIGVQDVMPLDPRLTAVDVGGDEEMHLGMDVGEMGIEMGGGMGVGVGSGLEGTETVPETNDDIVVQGLGALMEQQRAEGHPTFDQSQIDPQLHDQ